MMDTYLLNHAPNQLMISEIGLHESNLMLNRHLKTWLVRKGSLTDRLCGKREENVRSKGLRRWLFFDGGEWRRFDIMVEVCR